MAKAASNKASTKMTDVKKLSSLKAAQKRQAVNLKEKEQRAIKKDNLFKIEDDKPEVDRQTIADELLEDAPEGSRVVFDDGEPYVEYPVAEQQPIPKPAFKFPDILGFIKGLNPTWLIGGGVATLLAFILIRSGCSNAGKNKVVEKYNESVQPSRDSAASLKHSYDSLLIINTILETRAENDSIMDVQAESESKMATDNRIATFKRNDELRKKYKTESDEANKFIDKGSVTISQLDSILNYERWARYRLKTPFKN